MTDDWFRTHETGGGTEQDPHRPDLHGHDVDRWGGNSPDPNGPPKWVVRVRADEQTLATLAALVLVPVLALAGERTHMTLHTSQPGGTQS